MADALLVACLNNDSGDEDEDDMRQRQSTSLAVEMKETSQHHHQQPQHHHQQQQQQQQQPLEDIGGCESCVHLTGRVHALEAALAAALEDKRDLKAALSTQTEKAAALEAMFCSLNEKQREIIPLIEERKRTPFFKFSHKLKGLVVLTNRDLVATVSGNTWASVGANQVWEVDSGERFFELQVPMNSRGNAFIGLVPAELPLTEFESDKPIGYGTAGWSLRLSDGRVCYGGTWKPPSPYCDDLKAVAAAEPIFVQNDSKQEQTAVLRIGVRMHTDSTCRTIEFSCNGRPLGVAFTNLPRLAVRPAVSLMGASVGLHFNLELSETTIH